MFKNQYNFSCQKKKQIIDQRTLTVLSQKVILFFVFKIIQRNSVKQKSI